MNLSQFAQSRGLKQQTVSAYVQRHPEIFNGHISRNGKNKILDGEAISRLEEKYPLPQAELIAQLTAENERLRNRSLWQRILNR